MFPHSYFEIEEKGDHVSPSRYFDIDVISENSITAPYRKHFGSSRLRSVDGLRQNLSKIPGTLGGGSIERIGSHYCSPIALADIETVLLHYKFRPNFANRAAEEIARREYAQNGQYWTQYPDFAGAASEMIAPTSHEYRNWRDLLKAGLLKSSPRWDKYATDQLTTYDL
jgi:hypothetical protein